MRFGIRTAAARTPVGLRQTVSMEKVDYNIHCHVRANGVCGIAVTDKEYPGKSIFAGIFELSTQFEKESCKDEKKHSEDDTFASPDWMKEMLKRFQDPKEADKALKIHQKLKEIKMIMHKNVEELLKRGETLDVLMEDAKDLSESSKRFGDGARRLNSWCCRTY